MDISHLSVDQVDNLGRAAIQEMNTLGINVNDNRPEVENLFVRVF